MPTIDDIRDMLQDHSVATEDDLIAAVQQMVADAAGQPVPSSNLLTDQWRTPGHNLVIHGVGQWSWGAKSSINRQVYQNGIVLKKGKTYVLSWMVECRGGFSVHVHDHKHSDQHNLVREAGMTEGTHSITFTAQQDAENMRLRFMFTGDEAAMKRCSLTEA